MLLLSLLAVAAADPPPPDLAGTWRMTMGVVNQAKVPVLEPTTMRSHKINLARVQRIGDTWQQTHISCTLDAETTSAMITTVIPEALVRSMPAKTYPATVTLRDGQWQYRADLPEDILGYLPGFPMPEAIDDPGQIDSDEDGQPGITIGIRAPVFGRVDVYMSQHTDLVLEHGSFVSPDRIEGALVVRSMEQRILGASNRLFTREPVITPVPERSQYIMQRVPDAYGCAEVVAMPPVPLMPLVPQH